MWRCISVVCRVCGRDAGTIVWCVGEKIPSRIQVKTELRSLLQSVFLRPEALFHLGRGTTGVPLFLTDETGRRYVTPLQTVEYVLSYTSGTGSRRAILNFCGTCTNCTDGNIPPPNLDNHGSGTIDDCPTYTKAMTNIIEYFSADRFRDDKIHFELFNEPHKGRIQDAKYRNCLLGVGKLAAERRGLESVIFPAAGWEDHAAVTYDWEEKAANDFPQFDIGWHIYPWTCPVRGRNWGGAGKNRLTDGGKNRLTDGGVCTVQQYEDWVLNEQELPMRGGKLPPRVWLTEFGASLYESGIDYFDPEGNGASPPNMHANDLKGIANVLGQTFAASCSQIRGLFFWHGGYFFDDSYTVNGGRKPDGKNGASFLKAVMADVNSESCADCTSYWGAGVCERERCSKCRVGVRASAEDDVEDSILAHALERDATVYEGETVYV